MSLRIERTSKFEITKEHHAKIQEWIEQLRSGSHIQGQGNLKQLNACESSSSYCCLGIAAEFVFGVSQDTTSGVPAFIFSNDYKSNMNIPEWYIEKHMGIPYGERLVLVKDTDGKGVVGLETSGQEDSFPDMCVTMNDKYGLDFSTIADVIEAHINTYAIVKE